MKKVVGIVSILFIAAFLPAVSAAEKPAIAIIDTAIDTTQVKVFYEVCLLEENRCPNTPKKKSYLEGLGAAHMPAVNGFEHGTQMVKVAQKVNPDMNIIFIRIYSDNVNGTIRNGAQTVNSTVRQALEWVANNKTKFNIVAVSTSLGETNFKTKGAYCPVDAKMRNTIIKLTSLGVAPIFAAGNNGFADKVHYPACMTESVTIGSASLNMITSHSNKSPEVDFYALHNFGYPLDNMLTSGATAGFAAYWAKNYKGDFNSTYTYLKSLVTNGMINTLS